MKNNYNYSTAKVFPIEQGGFMIEAPTFEASTESSLDDVLRAVPNLLQEEEKGGWETYSTLFIGSTIVFMLRKATPLVLTASGSPF